MAAAGTSEPQEPAPREIPVRITRGIHGEDITIYVEAFSRRGGTFHDCSAKSRACCLGAFTTDEVSEFVRRKCDKEFGENLWIYHG